MRRAILISVAVVGLLLPAAAPARLADELGRNEVRVWAAPFALEPGLTVTGSRLPERLERLGYTRVHRRPGAPGEFFWGHETFWIFRREHRLGGARHDSELLRLDLERAVGRILTVSALDAETAAPRPPRAAWLEPELLAESLDPRRAPRIRIRIDDLPEHLPQAVLAIEDARFFDHPGIDARGVARALLRNVRAGRVAEGGSTITQQLIKLRDLSPKRTLGRKASEAARALALEAESSKREILEAYLDSVYFGHLDGVALYGVGAAARAFFSKPAERLSLAESALLAAMIQGPNRLHPARHPEAAAARQARVLARMAELGWVTEAEAASARGLPPLRVTPPRPAGNRHLLAWIEDEVGEQMPRRLGKGRGVIAESTVDPLLQAHAEAVVASRLQAMRRQHPGLRSAPLAAALVAIDGESGGVVALVGGEDEYDRTRRARRQTGSAVKPLVLLEAFERCGRGPPLHPASRIADRPLTIELESGPWAPRNDDGQFHGVVNARQALVQSFNVPFVRLARRCGFDATADRVRRAGYPLPNRPPPAFVLGAVEASPVEMARAFTVFAARGRALEVAPLSRLARPSGRTTERYRSRSRKVVDPVSAFLIRDLLAQAVTEGTASAAAIEGAQVYGKTGTSSGRRDAWFVGGAGRWVAAVWVGLDDGAGLGLSGAQAAVPIWREFMVEALASRASRETPVPSRLERAWIDRNTGLRVGGERRNAYRELFRRGETPRRQRWWRPGEAAPVIE